MDGGRKLWLAQNRPVTKDVPAYAPTSYAAQAPDASIRALREEVVLAAPEGKTNLVDVRSPDEYTGKVIAPPGMSETAQRGGHIPTAINVPWAQAAKLRTAISAGRRRAATAVRGGVGSSPYHKTIAYCRIGERSAHTWFVLKYLLGHSSVKNYDGSWTEWGNLVNAPIIRGDKPA